MNRKLLICLVLGIFLTLPLINADIISINAEEIKIL